MGLSSWSQMLADAGDSAKEFEPLNDGDYLLKVVKADAVVTSTQKDMFKVTTEVVGGPYNGSKVFTNLVVSPENPNAMGFFFRNMAAIGVPTTFFDSNPTNAAVAAKLVGCTFIGVVGQREYNNKVSNEIKGYKKDPNAAASGAAGVSGPPSAPGVTSGPPPAPVSAPATPPSAPAETAAPVADVTPATQAEAPAAPSTDAPPAPPF